MQRWVFDASPLIALGKADLLWLLDRLDMQCVVPEAVAAEIRAGQPADAANVWLKQNQGFEVVSVDVTPEVAAFELGAGESAVI